MCLTLRSIVSGFAGCIINLAVCPQGDYQPCHTILYSAATAVYRLWAMAVLVAADYTQSWSRFMDVVDSMLAQVVADVGFTATFSSTCVSHS